MSDTTQTSCCGVFKEAWHKLKGMKRHFWASVMLFTTVGLGGFCVLGILIMTGQVIYMPELLAVAYNDPLSLMTPAFVIPIGMWGFLLLYHLLQAIFEMFVLLPMRMGVRLIPLRRAAGKSIHALFAFKFFNWKYIWRFILLDVLIVLAIGIPLFIGGLLFCLPHLYTFVPALKIVCYVFAVLFYLLSLYLFVAYAFVSMIIIDRDIHPCEAMKLSRKTVTKRWFCIFGVILYLLVILVIGAALLLIGLLWAVPYAQNVIAILYRNMFGIEGKDPVSLKEAACHK